MEAMVKVVRIAFAVVFVGSLIVTLGHAPLRAAETVVVCSWGGSMAEAERECLYDPFEKATGIKVVTTSSPLPEKVRAQVDGGNVEWDIIIADSPTVMSLTEEGKVYLELMDYSKLDSKMLFEVIPGTRGRHSLGFCISSFNIAYSTKRFSRKDAPRTWADFWDVKKFPGSRGFPAPYGAQPPQLELSLLADGALMDQLYPLDVERAWKSMTRLKPNVTQWFKSNDQTVQALVSGEIDLACAIGPLVTAAKRAGASVDVEYNQGKLFPVSWSIVKGSKNREAAYKLIDFAMDPKRLACFSSKSFYGPAIRVAVSHMDKKIFSEINTFPKNRNKQFWDNVTWWEKKTPGGKTNRIVAIERFDKWI